MWRLSLRELRSGWGGEGSGQAWTVGSEDTGGQLGAGAGAGKEADGVGWGPWEEPQLRRGASRQASASDSREAMASALGQVPRATSTAPVGVFIAPFLWVSVTLSGSASPALARPAPTRGKRVP